LVSFKASWQEPPAHTLPTEHDPQFRMPPQLLEIVPQTAPCAEQVVQFGVSQVKDIASHTWPPEQPPQLNVPPHPSEIVPQVAPCAAQVVGVHEAVLWQEWETGSQ